MKQKVTVKINAAESLDISIIWTVSGAVSITRFPIWLPLRLSTRETTQIITSVCSQQSPINGPVLSIHLLNSCS